MSFIVVAVFSFNYCDIFSFTIWKCLATTFQIQLFQKAGNERILLVQTLFICVLIFHSESLKSTVQSTLSFLQHLGLGCDILHACH